MNNNPTLQIMSDTVITILTKARWILRETSRSSCPDEWQDLFFRRSSSPDRSMCVLVRIVNELSQFLCGHLEDMFLFFPYVSSFQRLILVVNHVTSRSHDPNTLCLVIFTGFPDRLFIYRHHNDVFSPRSCVFFFSNSIHLCWRG
jgi:hypothetical protein